MEFNKHLELLPFFVVQYYGEWKLGLFFMPKNRWPAAISNTQVNK